ncbi:MAG: hypothetical protein VX154_06205 [Pseudomonadota bacterium]|nr:hypothetical protein [Pseudomonadota bacterium]
MGENKSSAYAQAQGYIVQYFYVFAYLMQHKPCRVEFETSDDILVVFDDDKKEIWVQNKWSASDKHKIFQNGSDDLWKTFANWIDHWDESNENIEFHYLGVKGENEIGSVLKNFLAYKNGEIKKLPSEIALKYLNDLNNRNKGLSKDKERALDLISANKTKFDNIVSKLSVVEVSRDYAHEFRKRLLNLCIAGFIEDQSLSDKQLLDFLFGALQADCVLLLDSQIPFSISSKDFISRLIRQITGSKVNLIWQASNPNHDYGKHSNPIFLQQVDHLFTGNEVYNYMRKDAIGAYLDFEHNTKVWQTSGRIVPSSLNEYFKDVYDDYIYSETGTPQNTYKACLNNKVEFKGHTLTESKYLKTLTKGAYQKLANKEVKDHYIRWDPSFREVDG